MGFCKNVEYETKEIRNVRGNELRIEDAPFSRNSSNCFSSSPLSSFSGP